jgi:uncharacterized membrane protein
MRNEKNDEDVRLSIGDRLLAALSYCLIIPAFYVVLTEKRKNKYLAHHSAQALFYWIFITIMLIILRTLLNVLLSNYNLTFMNGFSEAVSFLSWIYSLYCAYLAARNEDFRIPLVSIISEKAE